MSTPRVGERSGGRPLVGRDRELEAALQWLRLLERGEGRAALIAGEAGIGKSRLVEELHARTPELHWVTGRCQADAAESAYSPITGFVRDLLQIAPATEAETASRVDAIVAAWDDATPHAAPLLKFLLRIDPNDAAIAALDPVDRRYAIIEVLRAVLARQARERPVVILVEDVHWIDTPSEQVLDVLATALPPRVMLLTTARLEYRGVLADRASQATLMLASLGESDASRVAAAVLRTQELAADLQRRIIDVSRGNPFQIEEAARVVMQQGERAQLPSSTNDIVLARLSRIRSESREAVEIASVIGQDFSLALLEQTTQIQERLSGILSQLQALEFVYQRDASSTFAFQHQSLRDAAYGSLETERKRALHRQVGGAMEQLYGGQLEHVDAIARHFEAAQDWPKALVYLLRAGQKAVADSALRASCAYFARAKEIADRLGDHARMIESIKGHGTAAFMLGEMAAAMADFDRLRSVARRIGDRDLECSAIIERGIVLQFMHDFDAAEAAFREGLELGGDRKDVARFAHAALASLHGDMGRLDEARKSLALAGATPQAVREPFAALFTVISLWTIPNTEGRFDDCIRAMEPWRPVMDALGLGGMMKNVMFRWAIALPYAGRGDYNRALALLVDALATCERFGDALTIGRSLNTLGWIHGDLQDHLGALEYNERAVQIAEAAGDPEVINQSRLNLGDSLLALGRRSEADAQFAIVEKVVRSPAPSERMMLWRYAQHLFHSRGELFLQQGDYSRAMAYADECLARAIETNGKKNIVKARRLRAQTMMARGDVGPARREIEQALVLARELGNPPQLWRTLAASGELYAKAGDVASARGAYAAAYEVLEQVAAGLADAKLRTILLASPLAETLRGGASHASKPAPAKSGFAMIEEGEVWAITYGDKVARVKDSRGMRMLHQLVARPNEELHVLDLMGAGLDSSGTDAIDREAAMAYKERLEDLRDQLNEAERFGDTMRESRIREELDAIATELARGVGLGGRMRKTGSVAERARVNVQRRLRDAIEKIEEHHAAAGKYLGKAIRTGTFCSYEQRE